MRYVAPLGAPARASVAVPGSKSITNRALLVAALADGRSTLEGALDSDDTQIFADCLQRLGIGVERDVAHARVAIDGTGGRIPARAAELFVGNAGTAARFVTAYLALGTGTFRVDGVPAMRARPIGELLDVVRAQGARIEFAGSPGFVPFTLHANGLPGGTIAIDARKTSQQVSGLLLIAPYARAGMTLVLAGEIVSEPYIAMTCAMMAQWGVTVERVAEREFRVAPSARYAARTYAIEPDASSASYFFAAAAASGGRVAVSGLSRRSLQGDTAFVTVLERMGATVAESGDALVVTGPARLHGVDVDMNEISDTAPTLAAIASTADGPTRIRGVEHMRWKETDRIEAISTELRRMGARVEVARDGMTIYPGPLHRARVATYDDHRMAMSLAVAGLVNAGVDIEDPDCVSKTFPSFWSVLDDACAQSLAITSR
ncbi:MAG: 3-phosphoshikimate 1-carboxyvinyltransferase [Vulcanimicrobiaceae bacterium]